MKLLKTLKLNNTDVEISYDVAKELVHGTIGEIYFDTLNEKTDFDEIQNKTFFVSKVGRKGSILYKGSEYATKAKVGIFTVTMVYDLLNASTLDYTYCINRKFDVVM